MITMEMVEKLRKYGDVTYEDAKSALEQAKGDMLDAVILLEKQGKIKPPENDGSFTVKNEGDNKEHDSSTDNNADNTASFGTNFKRFLGWCGKLIHKGNVNTLDVTNKGELVISIPVTLLVVFTVFFFWVTIPLVIIGLFFDYRYAFRGPNLGKEKVNKVVDSVANVAKDFKNSVKDAVNENKQEKDSNN